MHSPGRVQKPYRSVHSHPGTMAAQAPRLPPIIRSAILTETCPVYTNMRHRQNGGCRVDLKIGVVSKLSGFSPSGIRYFEERGIVSPSHGRDGTYRSFDLPDVARLLECRNYRECGCDTAEIANLLSHGSLCDVVASLYVAGVDGDFWSTPYYQGGSCNGFALASGVLAGNTAAKDLVA